MLICGASFAGLTVARELARTDARVLMVDRYEIGERQTSACAAPTTWLERMGLIDAVQQTFDELVVHIPGRTLRWPLPFTFSTFDYRRICALLRERSQDAVPSSRRRRSRAARASRCTPTAATCTPRSSSTGWAGGGSSARVTTCSRPTRACRAAWRSTRTRPATTSSCGSTRSTSGAATRGRFPPTASCASASARSTRATTSRSRRCSSPATSACRPSAGRATGSRISCAPPSRTGSSSSATPPGTACRRPPRASARPSTSASRSAASSWTSSRGARRASRRCAATARSTTTTSGSTAGCCACRTGSGGSRRRGCCRRDPRDQPARARALGVRQLPRHLPAGVRRAPTTVAEPSRAAVVVAA